MTQEEIRLRDPRDDIDHWKLWGPYVSERAWGTVREDYSATGEAWEYFPHDHARSRAYRWNEDGIAGISERHQRICFALAMWNGRDPILKERLFGLSGQRRQSRRRRKGILLLSRFHSDACLHEVSLQISAGGVSVYSTAGRKPPARQGRSPNSSCLTPASSTSNRYFDIFVEYAKADIDDICIRITVANRGPEAAGIHLLPTLWFRNTWSWFPKAARPSLNLDAASCALRAQEHETGTYWLYSQPGGTPLFTENETNNQRLFNAAQPFTLRQRCLSSLSHCR